MHRLASLLNVRAEEGRLVTLVALLFGCIQAGQGTLGMLTRDTTLLAALAVKGALVLLFAAQVLLLPQARAMLTAERSALNTVQHLSGIATLTRQYVDAMGGNATLLDTRKTIPGLRHPEKYATRMGGAHNLLMALAGDACLVIGGGSGHEPTFIGFVGRGLADACAANPSGQLSKWLSINMYFPANPWYYPSFSPGCCGTYTLWYNNTGNVSFTDTTIKPATMPINYIYQVKAVNFSGSAPNSAAAVVIRIGRKRSRAARRIAAWAPAPGPTPPSPARCAWRAR